MKREPKQAPCDQCNVRADELASDLEYYGAPACCQCAECHGTPAGDVANGDGDERWQRIDGVWSHDYCPLDADAKRELAELEVAEAWGFTDEAIGGLEQFPIGAKLWLDWERCGIKQYHARDRWQHAADDDRDDHDSEGEPCAADLAESANRVEVENGLADVRCDQRELWPDQLRLF